MNEALAYAARHQSTATKILQDNPEPWPTVKPRQFALAHAAAMAPGNWQLSLQDNRWLLSFDEEATYAN